MSDLAGGWLYRSHQCMDDARLGGTSGGAHYRPCRRCDGHSCHQIFTDDHVAFVWWTPDPFFQKKPYGSCRSNAAGSTAAAILSCYAVAKALTQFIGRTSNLKTPLFVTKSWQQASADFCHPFRHHRPLPFAGGGCFKQGYLVSALRDSAATYPCCESAVFCKSVFGLSGFRTRQ